MKTQLTEHQAFNVMKRFIESFHKKIGPSDDIAILLGSCKQNPRTGAFLKPAMWEEWLEAIEKVKLEEAKDTNDD